MSVGRLRRIDEEREAGLEERITGLFPAGSAGSRPTSLMDALHHHLSEVVEVTRAEMRVQAGAVSDLADQVERLEAAIAGLTARLDADRPAPASTEEMLQRVEARLAAQAAALEDGFRALMAWLDAPATPPVAEPGAWRAGP